MTEMILNQKIYQYLVLDFAFNCTFSIFGLITQPPLKTNLNLKFQISAFSVWDVRVDIDEGVA